jgi:hypothetical protein
MGLLEMENVITDEKDYSDFLSQNYKEMVEMGKEKLLEVSEKLLDIHTTVNEGEKNKVQ